jgi:hypothetical protein
MRIAIKQVKARKSYDCNLCKETIHPEEHHSIAKYQDGSNYHRQVRACLKHTWAELRAYCEVSVKC